MKILKTLAAVIFAAALPCAALAQTSPGLTYGQVPTPGQWNSYFAAKQDVLGFTPMNVNGGVFLGRVVTAPPGASTAGFNLTPGTTPGSPVNGDFWVTSAGFFGQANGVTIGPLTEGTSGSFTSTSPIVVSFPGGGVVNYACATCGLTGSPLSQFAATTSAQLAGIISDETGSGKLVFGTSPVLTTPSLGVASGTSLALGGASLGSNALAVSGSTSLGALATGAAQAAGVGITGAATAGTVAIAATDSGANTNITLDAKGGGQVTIGLSSGSVKLASASNIIGGAITYGGVALNNAVTGTGNMVLSASPTITGTMGVAALTASGQITSTLATGTAPLVVASQTNVANLNASFLNGGTFASPGPIGSGGAGSGAFTTLSASSTVSGAGFATYLASPPAIGGTAPGAGSFSTLSASSLFNISGAAAGQIQFPATQNPSANANTLDDYSEGTFTPVLSFGGASVGITYSAQSGVFTKIGNVVNYSLIIILTSKGTSTGGMSIGGLPISSSSFNGFSGSVQVNNLATSTITQVQAVVAASSTTLALSRYAAGANVSMADTDLTNTSIIRVTGLYLTN